MQKIGKSYNLDVFGSKEIKGYKEDTRCISLLVVFDSIVLSSLYCNDISLIAAYTVPTTTKQTTTVGKCCFISGIYHRYSMS